MSKQSDWKQSSLDRRDFRHTHGDPEIARHRKKPVKAKVTRCKHEYLELEAEFGPWYTDWKDSRMQVRYAYDTRNCIKCRRRRSFRVIKESRKKPLDSGLGVC